LLKTNYSIRKEMVNICNDWIINIHQVSKEFVTIPIASCSWEGNSSKFNFIKTKLRSTMLQVCLETLLAISIEHKYAYNINIDDVIETI